MKLALRLSQILSGKLLNFGCRKLVATSASKMVKEYHVHGYEEFTKLAESLESTGENVHILFSGGKDETGNRWENLNNHELKMKLWMYVILNR